MIHYMKYGPYICIGAVLAMFFVMWAFWGNSNNEFADVNPLDPNTCLAYDNAMYTWNNLGRINIEEQPVSSVKFEDTKLEDNVCTNTIGSNNVETTIDSAVIDNTPVLPQKFNDLPIPDVCINSPPRSKKGKFISRGERICCQTMEKIYGSKFSSVWPEWLINPETGETLELDCYNDDLKIAVEYNGEQHYKWPNFTNQTYAQFINQVRRDDLKRHLCDKHNVYLLSLIHI